MGRSWEPAGTGATHQKTAPLPARMSAKRHNRQRSALLEAAIGAKHTHEAPGFATHRPFRAGEA